MIYILLCLFSFIVSYLIMALYLENVEKQNEFNELLKQITEFIIEDKNKTLRIIRQWIWINKGDN